MNDVRQNGDDHPHDGSAQTVEAAEGSMWTCPMHPQVRRRGPGSCPICGMALEPVAPSLEEGPNPELANMTRRFRVSVALSIPLLALTIGGEGVGWYTPARP